MFAHTMCISANSNNEMYSETSHIVDLYNQATSLFRFMEI